MEPEATPVCTSAAPARAGAAARLRLGSPAESLR